MPLTSIVCGILLVLIGLAGYVYGVINNKASLTALIPAFFGVLILIIGLIARGNESLRKHLMHAAVVIALLGFIVPLARLISKFSELTWSAAVISQAAMAVVCLVFVVLAVRSFIAARKEREG